MRRWLALALFALVAPSVASAQTVRLSGVIADPSGAVLPGVGVRAALSNGQETPNTATTDRVGRYEFRLAPGTYTLSASLPGFASFESTVTLRDAEVDRKITLQVGTLQETITITPGAAAPTVRRAPPAAPQVAPPALAPSSPTSGAQPGPPPRPAPSSARPVRVGGSLKPPTKTANVSPVYPAALAAEKVSGTVLLEATIGADGHVGVVRTLRSSNDEFTSAAMDAIREWEFTPTLLNGSPVPVVMTATFLFKAE
jgi:TonB family protein